MEEARLQQAKSRFGIIGNAPGLTRAVGRALRVAPIDISVLVTGESGAGKEFFPRIIHQFSPRKHAKYIAVNCGAIPEGTIDSELFGHQKGAFTGALNERRGYFEEANGGTIFLDEVAELPLSTQARLLRVLETGEYLRVGSSEVRRTNIRVVAATNVDMARAVAEGRFREDLYYRLASVTIAVPPLRERGNDIVLLARKFAVDFADANRVPVFSLADDARLLLMQYGWPGNVRQLKNVVEQIALFEAGNTVDAETLRDYLPAEREQAMTTAGPRNLPVSMARGEEDKTYAREREMLFSLIFKLKREIEQLREDVDTLKRDAAESAGPMERPDADPLAQSLMKLHRQVRDVVDTQAEEVHASAADVEVPAATPDASALSEKEAIRAALDRHDGRRKAAADELGISERTLYRKIKEYGLE